ncbi:unnamed protein product [Effrenium voratum]|nr:unnamed protein product [Effrenium voratum]
MRFTGHVHQTVVQVYGNVNIRIPAVDLEDMEAARHDPSVLSILEQAVTEWSNIIEKVLIEEGKRQYESCFPMAEIDFWRDRSSKVSTVYEQLQLPGVKKVLEVLEASEPPVLQQFQDQFGSLQQMHVVAKDNVKFLTTLERHFKSLATGSMQTIVETLPSLMNAIRMVWIISRYFNSDKYMEPLMKRIADQIADKVQEQININQILSLDPPKAMQIIEDGRNALEKWNEIYLTTRDKMEENATNQRWDFDRTLLFKKTGYMSKICTNLYEIMQVLDQFYKFLGPELKEVTGDSQGIDQLLKEVEALKTDFRNVKNVFDDFNQPHWESSIQRFKEKVGVIEERAIKFLNRSFQNLRSAEGAFKLLQNFKNIESREKINKKMNDKFVAILLRYGVEVGKLKEIFQRDKENPPISKSTPPTAGAILWARSIFHRAKRPILSFKTMPQLLQLPEGQQACKEYVELGKEILEYEQALFEAWQTTAVELAVSSLKYNVLIKDPRTGAYKVNFAKELQLLIREAKYLDQLGGFELPHTVLNVALQQDQYKEFVEQLDLLIDAYNAAVGDLSPVQQKLLRKQILELDKCLSPGLSPLNWNSLGIKDFIEAGNQGITKFRGAFRDQVEKSEERITNVVTAIENATLVRPFDWNRADVMDHMEFGEFFERHRLSQLEDLVKKYDSIGPFLVKIEETTAGTKTGMAPSMAEYYHYWERRIFNAITTMLLRGMSTFQTLFSAGERKRPPLLRVKADCNGAEIDDNALQSVFRLISKLLKNTIQSAKSFVRWMDGTCRMVPPQPGQEDEQQQMFTFYRDVKDNPALFDMTINIQNSIQKIFSIIDKFLRHWKRYEDRWKLWDPKWKQDLEKVREKRPPFVFFDAHICVYKSLADSLAAYPPEKDIGFVRIDCTSIVAAIRTQAMDWVAGYGDILRQLAYKDLTKIQAEITEFRDDLQENPDSLDKLKFILSVISKILAVSMDMELRMQDVRERYRTLELYNCHFELQEYEDAKALSEMWRLLKDEALTKDRRMVRVKEHFSQVTQEQVGDFSTECKELLQVFKREGPGSDVSLEEGVELMKKYDINVKQFQRKREDLVKAQTLFNLPIQTYPELLQLEKDLRLLQQIYKVYIDHSSMVNEFSNALWTKFDINALTKGAEDFDKQVRRMPKEQKELGELPTFQKLEEVVTSFKAGVPLIQQLKSDAIRKTHWEELMALAGVETEDFDIKKMTLNAVFAMQLHRFPDEVNELVVTAQNELKIESELAKIDSTWRTMPLALKPYKGEPANPRGYVLLPNEEMKQTLDDHVLTLQSMSSSKYADKLSEPIKRWERNLSVVSEVFDAWMVLQRKWMYLESIFLDSEDISMQLPEQAKQFLKCHKAYTKIMSATQAQPQVLSACCQDGRLEEFKGLTSEFDRIQKSLTDYLDTKRSAFPRFYLISDDELLSILGTSDAQAVQPHMLKLFDNCKMLEFSRGKTVVGMYSDEGEHFRFHQAQKAEGAVEDWMLTVDEQMQDTLQRISKAAVYYYASQDRMEWIQSYIGMVAILGTQIWWTWQVEDAFRKVAEGDKSAMKNELRKENQQVQDLVAFVRSPINKLQRKKVNTLIILDVHARDIVDRFVRDSILSKEEFAWESQLRFYWDRKMDDVAIRQCTGQLKYCYEYQGLNGRLVITPLTDRCVMTLTTALTFNMGGAPAGPAGTGKTETVKDLAKSLAISCVVTNCGDGLDFRAMGVIFSGLSETGFWGCFDEFNRINVEVLSVVAAQIKTIQNGLNGGKKTVEMLGRDVVLKTTIGYFITMNPGYAGRSELPDNLKALFRPVTMIVPDLLMICENMLMSEGFNLAKVLAKKMTVLYSLSQGQLSKQYHYDFKLRALKSVLVMAGDLKRAAGDLPEDKVLMRALRDMNMPKFVKQDVPLFQGLLNDLFPGLKVPREGNPGLKDAIMKYFDDSQMHSKYEDIYQLQVDKVMQLYETMLTRHSTMIVGPTGGGKSVVLNCLAEAQKTALGLPTTLLPLNPKAITTEELYGVLDPQTRDWTDGLLSKIFREMNQPHPADKPCRRYIVYDGDVDAIWIENMNSVMDDNKLLTLTNGERIRLEKHCAMLFEVYDLQYASPATVSRCGMLYVDDKNLGPGPYYDRWQRLKQTEKLRESLEDLYEKYVPHLILYIFEGRQGDQIGQPLSGFIHRSSMGMDSVVQFTRLFDSIFDEGTTPIDLVENIYIFCLTWSLGAHLDERGRIEFDDFIKKLAQKVLPKQSLFDSNFDLEQGRWTTWEDLMEAFAPPPGLDFNKIFVPTIDTTRYAYLVKQFLSLSQPVLFIGESGTAKSVTMQNTLESYPADKSVILNINYSSRTSSLDFQRTMEDNISKRTGRIFGPEQGKKLRIFIDDLSMPKIDLYGTQQPLALLKFLMERMFMYERGGDLDKIIIQDCQFVSGMQPPGAGRNTIDPRVVSLYACIGITFPAGETVERIYSSILKNSFLGFDNAVQEACLQLPQVTMSLHQVGIWRKFRKNLFCHWFASNMQAVLENLSSEDVQRWWEVLKNRYGESQRSYHTLSHLDEMFSYFEEHLSSITDAAAVSLAIFFHDVIYNPRAGSPQNELESADLFERFVQESLPSGDPPGVEKGLKAMKVRRWIEQTAHHKCTERDELDCKLFMDFDMAVLGRPWPQYEVYSEQIRQEYSHVPEALFCAARSAFLESAASKSEPTDHVFATDAFRKEREVQAMENAAQEAVLLQEKFARCSLLSRLSARVALQLKALASHPLVQRIGAAGALGLCGTAAVLAPHSLLLAGVPAMGTVGYLALRLGLSNYIRQPLGRPEREPGLAVLAGSFNPPHQGHLELLQYLSLKYERVHAVIGVNPSKTYAVSPYVRQELLRAMLKELNVSNVEVVIVYSFVWKHVQAHGAKAMYRGLRSWQQDGAAEKLLEAQNVMGQLLLGRRWPIPTVYIQADPRFAQVSSTLLRQRLKSNEPITDLVPAGCAALVRAAYAEKSVCVIITFAAQNTRSSSAEGMKRFHYIFSLRDLSRVFQGICQADPQVVNSGPLLIRLWRNECTRVYEDRFNEDSDKAFLSEKQLHNIVKTQFSKSADVALQDPLVWGDFRDALDILVKSDTPYSAPRVYEDLGSWESIRPIFDGILELYNGDNSPMNLVLFNDALAHLLRLHRIIRLTRGMALLIGVGGSGKQSLTKLATFAAGYKLFEITLSRGYGDDQLRDDLKALYTSTIKQPMSFLFTDAHVVEEGFLEYINNILTVGMVPALFGDDEKEPLVGAIRARARGEGIPEAGMWAYACGVIRDNLHLVLAMSPAGSQLRTRCRNFPGLVAGCTIDWFFSWPQQALLAVADHFLANVTGIDDFRGNITDTMSYVHLGVTLQYSPQFEIKYKRRNFATPKNYLDFLSNYMKFLELNRNNLDQMSGRLGGGLDKLVQAAVQVTEMSKELEEKKAIVDENAIKVRELIDIINEKTEAVTKRKEEASAAAEQIEKDSVIIEREKADADEALQAALPALESAAKALEELDKKDVSEVKGMASPPPPVTIVCMCVVILRPLGKEDESQGWTGAKAMLSDVGFMRALQEYKKDDMRERQIKRIKELLNKEKETFEGEKMKSVSRAGYGLLQWVLAMVKYYEVAKGVAPKRELVNKLQQKKEEAEENLKQINKELKELAENLEIVTAERQVQSDKLKQLKEDADTMTRRLNAASQLIEGLASERKRWTEDLQKMGEVKKRLVGDCLLNAGFVSYAGPFNHEFRKEMVYVDWQDRVQNKAIDKTEEFKIETLLTSDVEVASWSGHGLPTDELCVQNGILVTKSARWPLCVDPQMQIVTWLKRKEEKAGLTVKTFNDEYVKFLELAIQYGKPFLFENLDEELDPMVDPVLERKTVLVNGQKMITLGDNQLEWNDSFMLYMTTKLSNPKYTPEVMGKASIVNCVITLDGLAAQLLNVVVGFERPDLEEMRQKLVQQMSDNRQVIKSLEDTLLRELAASKAETCERWLGPQHPLR